MDEHYYIMEKLIEIGHTDVRIRYNTNLGYLKFKKWDNLKIWEPFRKVNNDNVAIFASIDGINEVAEYKRKGTKWPVVEANIKKCIDEGLNFHVSCTTSIMNVFHIPTFIDRMVELGLDIFHIQLNNILNPNYKLQSHGVHTYEHLRPLIVAAYASNNSELKEALEIYIRRIENATTLTGGAIGDEWIAERTADATHTGYEYCSLHELLDSYTVLLQKQGNPKTAEAIETIFYNAAQGSRNPNHSCIAYLKTDNSFEMMGTKNGEVEPNRNQTRYKYSPAHQDVAVCCNPNAGRITPYFIEKSWLKENENTLVNVILMPNSVETKIQNQLIKIETITEYPYENTFTFKISNPNYVQPIMKIRKPSWATKVITNESYSMENDFIVIDRSFQTYPFYVTESTLNDWLKRMDKVLEAATWHYVNKKYDLPYEFATGSVVL